MGISTKKTINFVSKIIDELLSDEMKSKELLKEDNYFIRDIVDQNNYILRDNENILENQLEEIGDYKIQNIIMNNYSIIRAFVNSYYWKSNDLKTDELRNLKFYS